MKKLLLSLALLTTTTIFAQAQLDMISLSDQAVAVAEKEKNITTPQNTPAYNPDAISRTPQFPGGEEAMQSFFDHQIDYPMFSRDNGFEGTVNVKVLIASDGTPINMEVVESVNDDIDAAALQVIKAMPNWDPALQSGHPVKCKVIIPLKFSLK